MENIFLPWVIEFDRALVKITRKYPIISAMKKRKRIGRANESIKVASSKTRKIDGTYIMFDPLLRIILTFARQ